VLAFVATVAGNLTITGSAANIIVAEKARRLGVKMDFYLHAKVCCGVTLLCCLIGTLIISGIVSVYN